MKLHANARTCPHSRRLAVERVARKGWTLTAAAEAAGVSVRTVSKWRRRYREEGELGLLDRCSAPASVPLRTGESRVAVIASLRRLRMTGAEIAETLGMPASTVSGILTRIGLGKLSRLEPLEPPNRYEKHRAGELVHVDVKKLAGSEGRATVSPAASPAAATIGGRITSAGNTSTSASTTQPGSSTSKSSTTRRPRPRSASCAERSPTSPPSASESSG
jgi:transposase